MRGKIKYQILICALLLSTAPPLTQANATTCPDLRVVFADGLNDDGYSGSVQKDENYNSFKNTLESKLQTTDLSYEFINLDYPITSIGLENFRDEVGKYVTVDNVHAVENSTNQGTKNLTSLVNGECKETKYVIGGYSEGAMVVSSSLEKLDSSRIIYVATFGDPKLYLPEGASSCINEEYSEYRIDVPDCRASEGLLGAKKPYQPTDYKSKLGTWCNKYDVFCSAHLNASHHTAYAKDGIYEKAANIIYEKITQHFDIERDAKLNIEPEADSSILSESLRYEKPVLTIKSIKQLSSTEIKIEYEYDFSGAIVILDNKVIGLTVEKELTIGNLKPEEKHSLALVPIRKTLLGDRTEISLKTSIDNPKLTIPKTPNTGRH